MEPQRDPFDRRPVAVALYTIGALALLISNTLSDVANAMQRYEGGPGTIGSSVVSLGAALFAFGVGWWWPGSRETRHASPRLLRASRAAFWVMLLFFVSHWARRVQDAL